MSEAKHATKEQSSRQPANETENKRGRAEFLWNSTNSVIAGTALFFTGLIYYNDYRVHEDLSVGLFDYVAIKANDLATVTFEMSVANVGNRSAILADIRLIVPTSEDFNGYKSIPWRGLHINSIRNGLVAEREYIPPILVSSDGLITRNIHFMFNLTEVHQGPDGKIPFTLCFEVIDHAGQRVANHYGEFAAYAVDEMTMEFDPVSYVRLRLLPEPNLATETNIKCTR